MGRRGASCSCTVCSSPFVSSEEWQTRIQKCQERREGYTKSSSQHKSSSSRVITSNCWNPKTCGQGQECNKDGEGRSICQEDTITPNNSSKTTTGMFSFVQKVFIVERNPVYLEDVCASRWCMKQICLGFSMECASSINITDFFWVQTSLAAEWHGITKCMETGGDDCTHGTGSRADEFRWWCSCKTP